MIWREALQPVLVSLGLSLSPSPDATVPLGQEAVPCHFPTDPGRGPGTKQHGVPGKGGVSECPLCETWNPLRVWTVPLESSTWFNPVPSAFGD